MAIIVDVAKLTKIIADLAVKGAEIPLNDEERVKFGSLIESLMKQFLQIVRSKTMDNLVRLMNSRLFSSLFGLGKKR